MTTMLLPLFEVTVAFGILYWVLPRERYRDRLFERIATAFRTKTPESSNGPDGMATDSVLIGQLLASNPKDLSESYHRVSTW